MTGDNVLFKNYWYFLGDREKRFKPRGRLDYQPLFGKGARPGTGEYTRHERAAEIEPSQGVIFKISDEHPRGKTKVLITYKFIFIL